MNVFDVLREKLSKASKTMMPVIPTADAIEIVNQVEQEYNNDFCEWERDYKFVSDKYKVETGCGYTFYDLHHAEPFIGCPYCGKKIKVVNT